jgi:hypothetical protein
MKTIKIDLRFQRMGTTWCAIALVKSPYCPEPLEIITCIDTKDMMAMTGADAPVASSECRVRSRDMCLDSVLDSLSAPQNAPIVAQMAEAFDAFKAGMRLCSAAMNHDPRATLAIVDLHKRAEHDGDPNARKQLDLLRQCLEACTDGRCSFEFVISPAAVQAISAGINPYSGRGAQDMASGWGPYAPFPISLGDQAGGWGPYAPFPISLGDQAGWAGSRVNRMHPSNGARQGLWPSDMSAGVNPYSGRGAQDMASGVNPYSGRGAQDMASGRNPPTGLGAQHMASGRNPPNGLGAQHMSSGLNPFSGLRAAEMSS